MNNICLLLIAAEVPEASDWERLGLVLMGIGIAVFIPFILRRMRHGEKISTPEGGPVREKWERHKTRASAQNTADHILVELVETGREISARMDTKIRMLNTMIRDAERCISRLEELNNIPPQKPFTQREKKAKDTLKDQGEPHSSLDNSAPAERQKESVAGTPESAPENDKMDNHETDGLVSVDHSALKHAEKDHTEDFDKSTAGSLLDAAADGSDEEEDLLASINAETRSADLRYHRRLQPEARGENKSLSSPPPPPRPEPEENDINQKVANLTAKGLAVAEIARELGLSRQEVSLIQHLQEQRQKTP